MSKAKSVEVQCLQTVRVGMPPLKPGDADTREYMPPGSVISIEPDEAERLAKAGIVKEPEREVVRVVERVEVPAPPPPAPLPPEAEADRVAALVAAIPELDPDEDFTRSGAPAVKALERVVGWDVTMADRTAAWVEFQKAQKQ